MESPINLPLEDVLDLHQFRPKEVPDLLDDYFSACVENGIRFVRIIHGKGTGVLKARVQSILKRHPLVRAYSAADGDAGGWGATLVELRKAKIESNPPNP